MDDGQQQQFKGAVERKAAAADEASRAPHEEHAHAGAVHGPQKTASDASHEGPRPAGQKGGGSAKRWNQ